jgi:hypothetical protein
MVVHSISQRCSVEYPHEFTNCGEFDPPRVLAAILGVVSPLLRPQALPLHVEQETASVHSVHSTPEVEDL